MLIITQFSPSDNGKVIIMTIEFNGNKKTSSEMKMLVIDENATFGGEIDKEWYCRSLKVKDVYDGQVKTGKQYTQLELLPLIAANALVQAKQEAVLDSMVPVICDVQEVLAQQADSIIGKSVELVSGKYHIILKNTANVQGIDTSYKFDTLQLVVEAGGINVKN